MSTARLLMAAPGIIGLLALACFAALILKAGRDLRREELRTAERRARPPGVQPGTAAEDAAAILRDNLNKEQRMTALYDDADLCTDMFPGDDMNAGQLCDQPVGHDGEHKALAEVGPGWRRHITWPNEQQAQQ